MLTTSHVLAAASPPAGGAALGQVAGASIAATILTALLLHYGLGHRNGRVATLGRLADFAGRTGGGPGWAILPASVGAGALICAVFGLYWDVSLHIDNGRDPGPLANPAHYFILAGLFGIFAAGWLAVVLPESRPGPAAIRITRDWHAPVGGVLMMACASFALIGFPLDDVSHRLFGQDVTLWGPTHLMMLGGAAMTLIGIFVLLAEGRLAERDGGGSAATAPEPAPSWLPAPVGRVLALLAERRTKAVMNAGGLLIGLSIFQGEYDFGVPQFRLLYHPVLIAAAAALALTCARLMVGRGGALGAAAFYLVVRGALLGIVTGVFGESVAHFPLYLAEAAIVELVALRIGADKPYRLALTSGALIGTVGVLAEYGWSHVWMPLPWPSHLLPMAIALSLVVALAGGALGAFVSNALRTRGEAAYGSRARVIALASVLAIAAVIAGLGFTTTPPQSDRLAVTLTPAHAGPHRTAYATARFEPASLADGADWVAAVAWQGKGKLVTGPMTKIGPGVYRTKDPLPLFGGWKSYLRIHKGRIMASVPVRLPADAAIPVPAVNAPTHFTRAFIADHQALQRERKRDVPAWLWGTAGLVVLGFSAALLSLLGWGLMRLARGGSPEAGPEPSARTAPRELVTA